MLIVYQEFGGITGTFAPDAATAAFNRLPQTATPQVAVQLFPP